MLCSPARKMTISVPMFRQTAIMIIAGIDQAVLLSQSGPEIPPQLSMRFNSPSG